MTKEHRRFTEFANAVRKERTIGICHGDAGVGKTNSARRYANWDALEPYINEWGPRGDHDAKHYALANRSRTVFYTPEVLCRPKDLMHDIDHWQIKVGLCADEHLRSLEPDPPFKARPVAHLVELLIIDEAERLTPTALELLRDRHDREHLSIILIGMPGIDQRFRHYPQLCSRLGFSTITAPSAETNSSSSSTDTGSASDAPSTPTTSPTPKPSPPSNASPAATSAYSNESFRR